MESFDIDLQIVFFALPLSFIFSALTAGFFRLFKLNDHSLREKRSVHLKPTARLGGFSAIVAMLLTLTIVNIPLDYELVLVLSPIIFVGLLEDIGVHTNVKFRLTIGFISCSLFFYLKGIWVYQADVPVLDFLLTYKPFALAFTAFCLVGLLNSFNLIDGMNGLATGIIILVSGAILSLSTTYSEPSIKIISLSMLAVMSGLFFLNYPVGKIFLGDTGAYTFGLLIGICLITLKYRHPEISGWCLLLILFWPVTETIHSIIRRKIKRKASDRPDMMHMHHVIMRAVENLSSKKIGREYSNPISTALILPLSFVPILVALSFPENSFILFFSSCSFSLFFVITYILLFRVSTIRIQKGTTSLNKILRQIIMGSSK